MKHHSGRVEVICGSMFCGKTEELIRRVRRARIAKQQVQVFKPDIDTRFHIQRVTSHNGMDVEAISVGSAQGILENLDQNTTVVAIDEVQFFGPGIDEVVDRLVSFGIRVIIAGLDMDFRGEPFGSMPKLMSTAHDVQKFHAICMVCGEEASYTQRLIDGKPARYDDPIIMVGASEAYEARCLEHHIVPGRQKKK